MVNIATRNLPKPPRERTRGRSGISRESFVSHSYGYERFRPPLAVVGAVRTQWADDGKFQYTRRTTMSLSLVTAGEAQYEQEGRTGRALAGQVFLAHLGQSQRFVTAPGSFLHKRSIIIEGAALDTILRACGLDQVDVVTPRNPGVIAGAMRTLTRLLGRKPAGFAAESSALVYWILLELGRSLAPSYPAELQAAFAYIRQHLGDRLTLGDIARSARLSVRHCNRLFNQYVGVPPVVYVINQRMALAATILQHTSSTVKQTAAVAGYDDPFRFSLQFKQRYGISPKYYRASTRPGKRLRQDQLIGEREVPSHNRLAPQDRDPQSTGQERPERDMVVAPQYLSQHHRDAGD